MRSLSIRQEPWSAGLWQEMKPHGERHYAEVDDGLEPKRRFRLDEKLIGQLDEVGALKVIIARKHGKLIGYFTWTVSLDLESQGLLIAQQGAWYVAPGNWGVAAKMFDAAIVMLKACGVQCIYPHHRTRGRGAQIGRFFKRRGAAHIQHTYSLWIGD